MNVPNMSFWNRASVTVSMTRVTVLLVCVISICGQLHAQLPCYIDDAAVTEPGKWHFEFFNEYDGLQLPYPTSDKTQ